MVTGIFITVLLSTISFEKICMERRYSLFMAKAEYTREKAEEITERYKEMLIKNGQLIVMLDQMRKESNINNKAHNV